MFIYIIIAVVLLALYYMYYGYANRAVVEYVAPGAVATVKVAVSTGVGISRDVRAAHIDNEEDNLVQQGLADAIDVFARASAMDKSFSTVYNHREYRHNALGRLDAAKARQAARKASNAS